MRAADTHTHTQDNYRNPRCACAPRVNKRNARVILQCRCIIVCRHTAMFYVILNTRQRNFTYTVSRACANIYRFDLTRHLYYSWQVCALLVVGLRYTAVLSFACGWLAYTCTALKFLLNSSIIFGRTLVGSLPLANNVQHSASITAYNTLVLAFLPIKLGTLVHHITLMTKR